MRYWLVAVSGSARASARSRGSVPTSLDFVSTETSLLFCDCILTSPIHWRAETDRNVHRAQHENARCANAPSHSIRLLGWRSISRKRARIVSVFISWSGDLSLRVAITLKEWLQNFAPDTDIFVSTEDIAKGQRWSSELADRLETSSHGIICLTPENVDASWMHFEAGALSKSLEHTRVVPFLFGTKLADISEGPLGQFQCAEYTEADIKRMVKSLLTSAGNGVLADKQVDILFSALWPQLEEELDKLTPIGDPALERRSEHVRPLDRVGRDATLGTPRERIVRARKSVWLSGSTMNVAAGDTWRGFEKTDAFLQVILPDFRDERIVWATAINDEASISKQRNYMVMSADILSEMATEAGPIEVYLLSYVPSISYFAVDAPRDDGSEGYISVELQGFQYVPSESPNFTFFEGNENHAEFYDYLVSMWQNMLASAERYTGD